MGRSVSLPVYHSRRCLADCLWLSKENSRALCGLNSIYRVLEAACTRNIHLEFCVTYSYTWNFKLQDNEIALLLQFSKVLACMLGWYQKLLVDDDGAGSTEWN